MQRYSGCTIQQPKIKPIFIILNKSALFPFFHAFQLVLPMAQCCFHLQSTICLNKLCQCYRFLRCSDTQMPVVSLRTQVGLHCEQKLFRGQKYNISTQEHEILAKEPSLFSPVKKLYILCYHIYFVGLTSTSENFVKTRKGIQRIFSFDFKKTL